MSYQYHTLWHIAEENDEGVIYVDWKVNFITMGTSDLNNPCQCIVREAEK